MLKSFKSKLTACILLLALPLTANAYYVCKATSPYGWGNGWSTDLYQAKRNALQACANYTPYHSVCYIQRCWWEY